MPDFKENINSWSPIKNLYQQANPNKIINNRIQAEPSNTNNTRNNNSDITHNAYT